MTNTLQDCYAIMNDEVDTAWRTLDNAIRDYKLHKISDPEYAHQAQMRGLRALAVLKKYGKIRSDKCTQSPATTAERQRRQATASMTLSVQP